MIDFIIGDNMNTWKILFLSVLSISLLFGCDKNSEKMKISESSQEVSDSVTEKEQAPEPEKIDGYVILDGLSIASIEEGPDGNTASYQGKQLTIGEKVTVIGESITAVYRENEREYSQIVYITGEEQDGYVRTPYVIPNSTFAVIANEEAIIYKSPKITNPTNTILPRMSFVAIHNDFNDNKFVKVTYTDQESSIIYENKYLKISDVSDIEDDVVSAVLFYLASKQDGKAKTELLKNAQQFAGSLFLPDIEDALNELTVGSVVEEMSVVAIVNDDNVNIRDLPSVENGNVVMTVNTRDKLDITGRTKEEFTIQGITERWYRISEPEGWIFGAFLDM